MSFIKSEPQPLLSLEQVNAFGAVLHRELPGLAPTQRIRIRFREEVKHNWNEMDVYREGPYLVYDFAQLVVDPRIINNPGDAPLPQASLEPLPGQVPRAVHFRAILKDPASGDQAARVAEAAVKSEMVSTGVEQGVVDKDEANRLRRLIDQRPDIPTQSWRQYLEKRTTLRKAQVQGLMDDAAYRAQLERIEKELAP